MRLLLFTGILTLSFQLVFSQGSGCANIDAGANQTLPCSQTCTNVAATVFAVGETSSYTVASIPHAPPISYSAGGGTAVSVNTDDVWSNVINLPFPFCFYGATYTSCIIGSNGAINFNTASAGGYHPWPFSASVPSTALVAAGNVFSPYHDIDPSEGGSVKWYLTGVAPCRVFIVSFNNIPHYSCTGVRSTHMAVLYETTNIIEVYVNNKSTCGGWNSGNTVIGIQNPAGTAGLTPPGRNTGNWGVGTPEAWQFKPSGAPIYSAVQWYNGATLVGTGSTISVCPTPPQTVYTAKTTYTRCDGFQIVEQDNVTIFYDAVSVSVSPLSTFTCAGSSTTLTATSPTATNYLWTPGGMTTPTISVSPLSTTTYTCVATNSANGCSDTATATINIAQPISSSCNVLYVSPTGSALGAGSKTDPMDLFTALEKGACNGTVVKMAIGTYNTDTTIQRVTSYITLEGGFDPAVNWDKTSAAGATRILRSATQTTSLVLGNGIDNETGANPEVVAISIANQSGFRFQDLTIEVAGLGGGTTYSGYQGVDIVGTKLQNCNNYNFVRTRVIAGSASNGAAQIWSIPATNGGNSTGVELISNGANGNLVNCTIQAGIAGTGGAGGGANGTSNIVTTTGTALTTNDNNFNLAGQPVIRMDDVSCTATIMDFIGPTNSPWTFGTGSTPPSASGTTVSTQYSILGRKNINYASNNYLGFANIILDSQVNPAFTTSAPFVQGHYRVCAGTQVDFTATNGGIGYVYLWDLDGGSAGQNLFNGTSFNMVSGTFNTPGIYTIQLNYETNCCGVSSTTSIDLYVEDQPSVVMPSDENMCLGVFGGATLNIAGLTPNGSVSWDPPTGLDRTDSTTVVSLPSSTTTYTATLLDSTGLCMSTGSVTVNVIDLQLATSTTAANCITLGTASVVVTNGSGNYSYAWSNGAGNVSTATGLQPGTYTVYVTDNTLFCMDSADVSVLPGPGALTATMTTVDILCAGENNGSALVTVTGGTAPYTYTWSPVGGSSTTSNTSDTIFNLSQGTYTVDITDAVGCDFSVSADVMESSPIVFVTDSAGGPTCSGVSDGYIEISTDGGERPYSFTWSTGMPAVVINDAVVATNMGVGTFVLSVVDDFGCSDSISITLTAPPAFTQVIDTTICYGDSYTFPNGASAILTSDSSRVDSLNTAYGCDSIVSTNVTVPGLITGVFDTTICNGVSITYYGTVYNASNLSGTETLTATNGCDSVVTVTVTELATFSSNFDTTICNGVTFIYNGTTYGGGILSGVDTFASSYGCDSLHTINVTELPAYSGNFDTTICNGVSFTYNGTVYNAANLNGTETLTTVSGCDSVVTVTVTELAALSSSFDTTICNGVTFTYNGTTYGGGTLSGVDTFASSYGCDSLHTINVIELPVLSGNFDTTICNGVSITYNGTIYNASNLSGTETITASNGCDSIITVTVIELAAPASNFDTIICNGATFTYNGTVYGGGVLSGVDTFATSFGCDSLHTITVTELGPISGNFDTTICNGVSITYNGTVYNASNLSGTETLSAANGCDSVVTVTVIELAALSSNFDTTICNGVTFTYNGTTYGGGILSGVDTFASNYGCDSLHTISVTELPALSGNFDTIICNGATFNYNGTVYGAGTLTGLETLNSSNGCDSIVTVSVTELPALSGVLDSSVCIGTTFTFNGTVYGNGNFTGTEILNSSYGCDSSVVVTVTEFAAPIVGATASPNDTLCAGAQLVLNGTGANTYVWNNGVVDGLAFVAGPGSTTYNVTGTDANGCLAAASITVFAFTDYNFTLNASICSDEQHTLPDGSMVNTAGVYTSNFLSVNGCDSTYTTTLSVNQAGTFALIEDLSVCSGFAQTLTVSSQNMVSFEWFVNNGGGTQSLIANPDYIDANTNSLSFNLDVSLHQNIYRVVMTDACGRSYSTEMTLEVFEPHTIVNGVKDTVFCQHEITGLSVDYNGYDYVWSNGATGTTIIPEQAGTYIVNFVENGTNCLLSDTIEIGIEDCIGNCVVLAPTAFSPNESGANDIFRVVTTCDEGFSYFYFAIFNRWGEMVYSTDDWREGWDGSYKGRDAEIGTFSFYVEYTKELSNKKEMLRGNVSLIR